MTHITDRELNVKIMRQNISNDSVGRTLAPEAVERAAQFAADVWRGQMGSGDAAKIGIKHVTEGTLK